jgi:hypothetical protein
MISLEWIKVCVKNNKYYFSLHGDEERQNENITIIDVEESLLSGQVLENYNDTGRGESCLIAGFTNSDMPVHIVCGERNGDMVIITVYIPMPPYFLTPYSRRPK